jgi:hypothetical protein
MTVKHPFTSLFTPTEILEKLHVLNAAARARRLKNALAPAATPPPTNTPQKDLDHE